MAELPELRFFSGENGEEICPRGIAHFISKNSEYINGGYYTKEELEEELKNLYDMFDPVAYLNHKAVGEAILVYSYALIQKEDTIRIQYSRTFPLQNFTRKRGGRPKPE